MQLEARDYPLVRLTPNGQRSMLNVNAADGPSKKGFGEKVAKFVFNGGRSNERQYRMEQCRGDMR